MSRLFCRELRTSTERMEGVKPSPPTWKVALLRASSELFKRGPGGGIDKPHIVKYSIIERQTIEYLKMPATPKADHSNRPGPLLKFEREVPAVRRVPIALARRFVQICTSAAAEVTGTADLTPQEFAVLAYVNREVGE